MNKLTIVNTKGKLWVDSREVAELTGKEHKHLLRDIRGYIEILNQSNFGLSEFFIEDTYKDVTGREQPCYLLTKKGCDMVANKMTGEKGVIFTAAYVTRFEEMEQTLREQKQLTPMEQLKLQYQVLEQHEEKLNDIETKVNCLENTMTIDYGEQLFLKDLAGSRAIKAMGGKDSAAYKDKSLRTKVFSTVWKDYKDYFDVNSYRNTAKKDYERAKEYLKNWQAQGKILREIEDCNNQIKIEREAM